MRFIISTLCNDSKCSFRWKYPSPGVLTFTQYLMELYIYIYILLSQYTTSILLDFLTLGTVRERFDTLLTDRPFQNQ